MLLHQSKKAAICQRWQCPLRCGSCCCGPVVRTAILRFLGRSGNIHYSLELALRSGSAHNYLARAIWPSAVGSGSAHCDLELAVEDVKARRQKPKQQRPGSYVKSDNPHPTGTEK